MSLLESWMPTHDVSARYAVRIDASPARVYATLMATDFGGPWLVRTLMGIRLIPAMLRAPGSTWRRFLRRSPAPRASLAEIGRRGFVRLEEAPSREIVLGITGRFWTLAAETVDVPPERFREPLAAGLAQAVWNFEVIEVDGGSELATETRIRCADPATLRSFRRYWRLVSPGSGLIRHAILRQVRREAMSAGGREIS